MAEGTWNLPLNDWNYHNKCQVCRWQSSSGWFSLHRLTVSIPDAREVIWFISSTSASVTIYCLRVNYKGPVHVQRPQTNHFYIQMTRTKASWLTATAQQLIDRQHSKPRPITHCTIERWSLTIHIPIQHSTTFFGWQFLDRFVGKRSPRTSCCVTHSNFSHRFQNMTFSSVDGNYSTNEGNPVLRGELKPKRRW